MFDADGLIKLNRAGALERTLRVLQCEVPEEVYDEVVTRGIERQHQDASVIGDLIARHAVVVSSSATEVRGSLGRGERAILELLSERPSASVITDDRPFIALLRRSGINFVTPADLLITLVESGEMMVPDALEALDRMRDLISRDNYTRVSYALRNSQGEQT